MIFLPRMTSDGVLEVDNVCFDIEVFAFLDWQNPMFLATNCVQIAKILVMRKKGYNLF